MKTRPALALLLLGTLLAACLTRTDAVDAGADEDEELSQGELDSVNDIVKASSVIKAIRMQTAQHDVEIIKLERHLESELKDMEAMIRATADHVEQSQREHEAHLVKLHQALAARVDAAHNQAVGSLTASRTWLPPTLVLLLVGAGLTIFAMRKFRSLTMKDVLMFTKSHV